MERKFVTPFVSTQTPNTPVSIVHCRRRRRRRGHPTQHGELRGDLLVLSWN